MITDDELQQFTERPSLRERAKQAAREAAEAEQLRKDSEYSDLCIDAREFLADELDLTPGEVYSVEFERKEQNIERPKVEFTVDGIRFCAYNSTKPIMITNGQGDKERVGTDLITKFYARVPGQFDWTELVEGKEKSRFVQLGEKLAKK